MSLKKCMITGYTILISTLVYSMAPAALSDEQIAKISAGFEVRRDAAFEYQLKYFLDSKESDKGDVRGIGYRLNIIALSGLYLNKETDKANEAVLEVCEYLEHGSLKNVTRYTNMDEIYWWGNTLCRIYELFGSNSKHFPGRLSPKAQERICDLLWKWASVSKDERGFPIDKFTSPSVIWDIWFSENHQIMRDVMAWETTKILSHEPKYKDRKFEDGMTAAEHFGKWNEHLKLYLVERAKRGFFVETASIVYTIATLHTIYNIYDFAEDPALADTARKFLDLWWTDWALEQIETVRGGAKSRSYSSVLPRAGSLQAEAMFSWLYLGIGNPWDQTGVKSNREAVGQRQMALNAATSKYRLPAVVIDIATDIQGRGSYEYIARRPGRNLVASPNLHIGNPERHFIVKPTFIVDPNTSGSVDYTYVTPDFVLGSYQVPMLPESEITAIHSQATWQGLIFRGVPEAGIYPRCTSAIAVSYNQHRSVQYKQTLIVQKNAASLYALDSRVFFATTLKRSEDNGWIFVEAPWAYAAIHVVDGGYTWDDGNWLKCKNDYSPIIFEVAQKSDYNNIASFKAAVLKNKVKYEKSVLKYKGLSKKELTLYAITDQSPEIDSVPLDYAPKYTFNSPYMSEEWASGVVTINKDGRKLILDFNKTDNKLQQSR